MNSYQVGKNYTHAGGLGPIAKIDVGDVCKKVTYRSGPPLFRRKITGPENR